MTSLRDELVREGPSHGWRMVLRAAELDLLVHEDIAKDGATKDRLKKIDFQNLLDARNLFDEINAHLKDFDGPEPDTTKPLPSKGKRNARE